MSDAQNQSLFASGNVAVITGAASGIGRAAAETFVQRGMKLVLFDNNADALAQTVKGLTVPVRSLAGDVGNIKDVEQLRDLAFSEFGPVTVVMNNAAIGGRGSDSWNGLDAWHKIIDVNLWGVVNGVHAFTPALLAQGKPAAIINTGSKQGITNPPGYPAYAVSKAGVKVLTEQLAHSLRETGKPITAHLLVPGWTFTGMTDTADGKKPDGAWTSEQVIDMMMSAVDAGDFYIICPDNAVSPELDKARLLWSAEDMTENRPALSRWHPDWKDRFEASIKNKI